MSSMGSTFLQVGYTGLGFEIMAPRNAEEQAIHAAQRHKKTQVDAVPHATPLDQT